MTNEQEIFGTVEPVSEEKQDMIDFGLVEDEKAAEHIDHEIETIVDASAALEEYSQILTAAKWDGVSKQTAQAMRIGISRIDRLLGQKSTLVASLEDEGQGDIKRIGSEQSSVNKEGIGARLKELWTKFVELIKAGIEKAKGALKKAREMLVGREAKIHKLQQDLKEYNPNGPTGGLKVTIPAKTARLSYPNGKHQNSEEIVALLKWAYQVFGPAILKSIDNLKNFKGTESPEEIKQGITVSVAAPTSHPASISITSEDGKVRFEVTGDEGEEVTIPVRSNKELGTALGENLTVSNMFKSGTESTEKLHDGMMALIGLSFSDFVGEESSVKAVQDAVTYLREEINIHWGLTSYCLVTSGEVINHIGYEIAAGGSLD